MLYSNVSLMPCNMLPTNTSLPALVAGRHDQLAMILYALDEPAKKTTERIVATVCRTLQQMLPQFTFSVGIGQVYVDLHQVSDSYTEAGRALQVIQRG